MHRACALRFAFLWLGLILAIVATLWVAGGRIDGKDTMLIVAAYGLVFMLGAVFLSWTLARRHKDGWRSGAIVWWMIGTMVVANPIAAVVYVNVIGPALFGDGGGLWP